MDKYASFKYLPPKAILEDGRRATGCREHRALSRKAARESAVLLKNENGALPFAKGECVALFGKNTYALIAGGGGSGFVASAETASLFDGLSEKEKEGKIALYAPLSRWYLDRVDEWKKTPDATGGYRSPDQPLPPKKLLAEAAKNCRKAVVTLGRFSTEGADREAVKGDWYLDGSELRLLEEISASFPEIVVILNICGQIDCEVFEKNKRVKSILCVWLPGMEGGRAAADLLCGDANPCGKLVDTFAKDYKYYPSAKEYKKSPLYMDYTEDIYVGYRYFETIPGARKKVRYEFGYGLSYTNFSIGGVCAGEEDGYVTVACTVTNTGGCAGKETVQLYLSAPQGLLGKPARVLAAFRKTRLLFPGESETLALRFALADFACYDDLGKIRKSAYILEKGEYAFYLGNSVRKNFRLPFSVRLRENRITEQLTQRCCPFALKKRLLSDGTYEKLPTGKAVFGFDRHKPLGGKAPSETLYFENADEGSLDAFIAQMTDEELVHMVSGTPERGIVNTGCFPGLARLHVPDVPTSDGPAGIRMKLSRGKLYTTAFPMASSLACSWDPDLLFEVCAAGALEARENNIGVWLTPAVNIHRDPLCGRNFEYYSEDPLIAGEMAASAVRGIQSRQVAACVKHFAANSKENDRFRCDSRISERALREIYLNAFHICVKKADPWSFMSSYNLLNGLHTSQSRDLLSGILRGEWGFHGMITSDWGGHEPDQINEAKAGNDVRMSKGYPEKLKAALSSGELKRADLEVCVKRTLMTYLKLYSD